MAKKKVGGVVVPRLYKCRQCKEGKPKGEFEERVKLLDGISPWCKTCWDALEASRGLAGDGTNRYEEFYKQYRRDYQARYQQARREQQGVHDRDVAVRETRAFTRDILRGELRLLTPETAVLDGTRVYLLSMMSAFENTNTWMEYEDEVLDQFSARDGVAPLVLRILPVELYPELSLVEANCYAFGVPLGKRKGVAVWDRTALKEGLDRLRGAIEEACYA